MATQGNMVFMEPFRAGAAVTKSDVTVFAPPFNALYIGTTGNVAVKGIDGTAVTLVGVLAGTIYPISGSQVMETNTTASNIVALYR